MNQALHGDIADSRFRPGLPRSMADGMQQVRFAHPGHSVKIEWTETGAFRRGLRRRNYLRVSRIRNVSLKCVFRYHNREILTQTPELPVDKSPKNQDGATLQTWPVAVQAGWVSPGYAVSAHNHRLLHHHV